ncbi:MAG: hypothetical protein UX35_C0010G0078 [Microgenomates group bacterium GW2011_GWA1_46_15]|nr:MAG: hypothetical protein UX35_C0010G0078 [Microgenomates group bacterium GW2011_GWA1_46_15]KKU23823.1 MAG: hypothetical protein UX36_C0003G0123 [Microgenomates group bacterium GW2011_GWC1_46_15]
MHNLADKVRLLAPQQKRPPERAVLLFTIHRVILHTFSTLPTPLLLLPRLFSVDAWDYQ